MALLAIKVYRSKRSLSCAQASIGKNPTRATKGFRSGRSKGLVPARSCFSCVVHSCLACLARFLAWCSWLPASWTMVSPRLVDFTVLHVTDRGYVTAVVTPVNCRLADTRCKSFIYSRKRLPRDPVAQAILLEASCWKLLLLPAKLLAYQSEEALSKLAMAYSAPTLSDHRCSGLVRTPQKQCAALHKRAVGPQHGMSSAHCLISHASNM